MNKLQIYKASAGSGKTYLLTENYLKLALQYPDKFSKILAVTFTNKAAEEMKSRIIEELNSIINDRNKAAHFSSLKKHLKYKNDDTLIERALLVRGNILHNYSLFYVSTIDSFVQKVIRAFSYEMNLNSGYDIEMDTDKVISDLSELLYNNISENIYLQNWLIKFAEHKINDGKNWDFRNEIKDLANEIFKETFQSLYTGKNEESVERDKMQNFLNTLYTIKNKFEKSMEELRLNVEKIIEKTKSNSEKLGRNFDTIKNQFLKKIPAKKYDEQTKAFENATKGFENWHAKTAKKDVIYYIQNVYDDMLKNVEKYNEIFNNYNEDYYTSIAIIQSFHSFGILNNIASFLPEYRNDNNLLLISDTTLLLKKIIGDNEAPFIYEKIGNRFKNILIDEFQDTSTFQWANFKPLILNSLSEGNYNLIVGDIKQSIYRWRGGDWKLLLEDAKKDIGEHNTEDMNLDTNWRSKKNIIDFNNVLFQFLPRILQDQYNHELEKIKNEDVLQSLKKEAYNKILIEAYEKNCQKVPNSVSKKGGKVQVFFSDSKKDDDKEGENNEENRVPELINKLLKKDDYKAKDIGILVRTNVEAQKIVNLLLDYQSKNKDAKKYQIISADSLHINNSNSVKLLISAMKFIHNKEDEINIAQLVFQYQKIQAKEKLNYNDIFLSVKNEGYTQHLPKAFLEDIQKLSKKSAFELSEELIRIFKLNYCTEEFTYLQTFQNSISDFTKNRTSDLAELLRWWDEKGKTTSVQISDKVDAIQVITIHKSKGLAFNIVIMPYADWNIDHSGVTAPLLWTSSNKKPFNEFKALPVKYSSKLLNTVFRKKYFDEKLYTYVDALNVLYVALTRAENELYIFSKFKPSEKVTSITKIGQLLYELLKMNTAEKNVDCGTLINLTSNFNKTTSIYTLDKDHNTIYKENKKDKEKNKIKDLEHETEYPNNEWTDRVEIRYNSEDFFIESIEAIEEKVNFGTLMHQIFANINTEKDVEISLKQMYFNGFITEDEQVELKAKVLEIIRRKDIKEWFSDKYEVKNEEALITTSGDIRIPDRVLIGKDEVIVIDFKFGIEQEKYKMQILEYKELIKEVYKKETKAYLFYVEKNVIVEV